MPCSESPTQQQLRRRLRRLGVLRKQLAELAPLCLADRAVLARAADTIPDSEYQLMSNAPFPPITDVEGGPSSGGGGGTWQATVQRQDDLMRQQDRGLDELSRQVRGLHNMGTAIGDEIRLQDGLLDQLGNDVDRTRGNMQSTTARAKRLLKKSRDNWKMCTIVLLIIGLGVVLYLAITMPSAH